MMKWLEGRPGCDMSFAEYLAGQSAPMRQALRRPRTTSKDSTPRIAIESASPRSPCSSAPRTASIATDLFRVAAGYDAVTEFLAEQFRAAGGELALAHDRATHRVAARQRADRGVHSAEAESSTARRALITVPLGVLQADAIEFAPPPTEILAHARRLAMGDVVRIVLLFRDRFWRGSPRSRPFPTASGASSRISAFCSHRAEVPPTWWTPNPGRRTDAHRLGRRHQGDGVAALDRGRATTPSPCRAAASRRSRACSSCRLRSCRVCS